MEKRQYGKNLETVAGHLGPVDGGRVPPVTDDAGPLSRPAVVAGAVPALLNITTIQHYNNITLQHYNLQPLLVARAPHPVHPEAGADPPEPRLPGHRDGADKPELFAGHVRVDQRPVVVADRFRHRSAHPDHQVPLVVAPPSLKRQLARAVPVPHLRQGYKKTYEIICQTIQSSLTNPKNPNQRHTTMTH